MQEIQKKEAAAKRVIELSNEFLQENDHDLKGAAAILMALAGTLYGPKGGVEALVKTIAKFNEEQIAAIQGR